MGDNIGKTVAANGPSKGNTVDRIYDALNMQDEILSLLDMRLGVVSNRSPQEDSAKPEHHVHLDNVAYRIENSNKELQRLINELVI